MKLDTLCPLYVTHHEESYSGFCVQWLFCQYNDVKSKLNIIKNFIFMKYAIEKE